MNKEKCSCGKMAVWIYLPSTDDERDYFYCEECVPRGCSCNHEYVYSEWDNNNHPPQDHDYKWIVVDFIWTLIDDKGREYPCCEYSYSADGFDEDTTSIDVIKHRRDEAKKNEQSS